ncbi:hypothetical protein Tco_1016602 [Tanacetum coccineum]|uniref:Reverse transcriptase domain-containing protein n=1 Tax=Tanacetum coccineum TaxID=301880 RepID=A0ABQ5FRN9_9ASTR
MPLRVMSRSADRPAATSLGGWERVAELVMKVTVRDPRREGNVEPTGELEESRQNDQSVEVQWGVWIESLTSPRFGMWNSQNMHMLGREVVVGMSWDKFKVLMREEFCPSNETQKLETELWNHAMVGAGYAAYTDRFHKLAR